MPARPPTPAPGDRPYHHGDLKPALRAAALALITVNGPHAVSLREIAQAAGVSHTAAYRHYADKQALLADIAAEGFRMLDRIQRRTLETVRGGPAARLAACGRDYVRFGVEHPHLLALMFGDLITDWGSYPALVEAGSALSGTLESVIRDGQQAGAFKAGDPRELALACWALVHGLASLIVGKRVAGRGSSRGFAERSIDACIELLLDGISATPVRRR